MEEDTHQPNELKSQMRVMKTYLKARYRLSDLLRAQRNDRMKSNLKRWIENGSPDKGDLEKDSYRILRQYFMQKEGRLYLNKDGILACKRREEDRVLYKKENLYRTENLIIKKLRVAREAGDLEAETGEEPKKPEIGGVVESYFNLPNEYSGNIVLTDSDFILTNRKCAMAITADMSFRTALAADFKRDYKNVEFLWKQRPGIGGVAALPSAASQIPGKYLCFLVTRATEKTVQVTPQVMRMLGGLLEREVTRDDPEWTAAVASLIVSEKMKIMPSRRQHEENERDCRTIVQQLVSTIPHEILTSTSYGRKEQGSSTRRKTVTFVDQDKEGEKVEQNLLQDCLSGEMNDEKSRRAQDQHPGQESLSGESEMDEKIPDEKQDLENKVLCGEFRWMRRRHIHDLEERADSVTNSSTDDNSQNSGIDSYSDRNSSS